MGQNEGPTTTMNGQIYESLVTRDSDMVLEPSLAETWKPLGAVGWEFALRKGVKFHDGADFTAEDVAFSITRAQAKSSDFKEQVKSIKEVKIVDDYRVQFLTDGSNPILPNQITNIFMMDKGWAEKNNVVKPQDFAAGEETFAVRNTNGTGPFMVEQRLPDELTVLVKNPNWWAMQQPSTTSTRSNIARSRTLRPAWRRFPEKSISFLIRRCRI